MCAGTGGTGTDPHECGPQAFDKGAEGHNEGETASSTNGAEKPRYPQAEMKKKKGKES